MVEALSEALRMELAGTKVKISCIELGLVMTDLHHNWDVHPSISMEINNQLQPKDIAEKITYILEQADYIRTPKIGKPVKQIQ